MMLTTNPLPQRGPTEAKPVPPLPVDPGLPHLARALDGLAVRRALRRARVDAVEEARPRYVRYKPQNKAIVLYDVQVAGRSTAAVVTVSARRDMAKLSRGAQLVALSELVRGRTLTPTAVTFLKGIEALVEWFPLNRLIPGLALAPSMLGEHIGAAPHGSAPAPEPAVLTYKPERRATCRWGHLVLKAYARASDFDQAVGGFAAAAGAPSLTVPALVAARRECRVTLQSILPGTRPDLDRAEDLGRALAALHAAPPRSPYRVTARDHLTAAATTCRHLRFLLPSVADYADRLIARLRSATPREKRLVQGHGDFHADQALLDAGEVALIDFDHACIAAPALDAATFAAHLVDGTEASLDPALGALERLLCGYGDHPSDLSWFTAVAILRRAATPFRELAPDWPTRVAGLLRAAAQVATSRDCMAAAL